MQSPPETKTAAPRKPIATITREDGAKIEVLSMYLQKDTPSPLRQAETEIGLPLASGVIVHFTKMKSFEIRLVKRVPPPSALGPNVEDWDAEATITLLDGTAITEKLAHRSHLAELRGAHALGSFEVTIRDTRRVDFQW
jgi:hypothetical protein